MVKDCFCLGLETGLTLVDTNCKDVQCAAS
jgi:hypothetical protein